ncbi:hypothetical protein LMG9964_02292 [Paraburkholderia phenoliruptrix]|uniref:Uncharacterized protein n=1 Tax=Paraburkholderia phenoliruptrix TaxID=252970 RepID=A0A6J5K3V5_9BURK|nr:hypothetical protein LMG9964_02292 [Paraburkholderia phenoliruptrix]
MTRCLERLCVQTDVAGEVGFGKLFDQYNYI